MVHGPYGPGAHCPAAEGREESGDAHGAAVSSEGGISRPSTTTQRKATGLAATACYSSQRLQGGGRTHVQKSPDASQPPPRCLYLRPWRRHQQAPPPALDASWASSLRARSLAGENKPGLKRAGRTCISRDPCWRSSKYIPDHCSRLLSIHQQGLKASHLSPACHGFLSESPLNLDSPRPRHPSFTSCRHPAPASNHSTKPYRSRPAADVLRRFAARCYN